MANRYLYSGAGSPTSPYTTADWTKAANTLAQIDGVDTAGDIIYTASDHSQTTSTGSYAFAGTLASPSLLISTDRLTAPPTTSVSGASIIINAASTNFAIAGSVIINGFTLSSGSGQSTTCSVQFNPGTNGFYQLINCTLRLLSSGTSSNISIGNANARHIWINTTVKFAAAGQTIQGSTNNFTWNGGGLESGGTSPTTLFTPGSGTRCLFTGLDLSTASAGMNIFSTAQGVLCIIRDSRLPSSWSGALVTGSFQAADRYELYNCSDGAQNYYIRIADPYGSITENTSVYKNSGYSMDGTPMSWAVTGSASSLWPSRIFYTPEFGIWVSSSSGYTSVTVAVATNNITLTDEQCWLEVISLDSASYPLGTLHSDDSARVGTENWLAAASNQTTDGTSTWTGVPGTPVLQKLTAAIAPGMSGYILCRVGVAISGSQSVYIDAHPVLA